MRRRRRHSIKPNLFLTSNFITNTPNANNNQKLNFLLNNNNYINEESPSCSMVDKSLSIISNIVNHQQCILTFNNKRAVFFKIILYKKLFFDINKICLKKLNSLNLLTYSKYDLIKKKELDQKKYNCLRIKKTQKLKPLFIQFIIFTGILLMAFNMVNARVIDLLTASIHRNNHSFIDHNNNIKNNRYRRENVDKTSYYNKQKGLIVNSAKKTDSFEDVIVITSSGKVRGFKQVFDNNIVNTFLGVPYAQTPTGNKRFRRPEPIKPWKNEFIATVPSYTCYYTIDTMFPQFPGAEMWNPPNDLNEDCLSMNIWVPAEKNDGNVLVWIYGGGFFSGSPSLELYDGRVIAAMQKSIVININYRLGPFGFLYFGHDSIVPGNMGLLDQQLALKWIYDNVAYFGGDPHRITLFGESAGGSSASAHLFAPESRSYFKKLILMSGAILNNWATKSTENMLDTSLALANRLNCTPSNLYINSLKNSQETNYITKNLLNEKNIEKIVECMSKVSPFNLQKEVDEITSFIMPMTFAFVPIDEDKNFFQGNIFEKMRQRNFKKDVSVLIGTVKDEGTYWLPYYLNKYGFTFNHTISAEDRFNQALISETEYTKAFNAFLPYFGNSQLIRHALMHAYQSPHDDERLRIHYHSTSSSNLASTFLKNSDTSSSSAVNTNERWRNGISRFFGDHFFTCSVIDFADFLADNIFGSVFMYYFKKRSSANPWPKWMGVMHGYEIEYVFGLPLRLPQQYITSQLTSEKQFSKKMMEFWSDFARIGEPVKYWPKYDRITRKSLILSDEIIQGNNHRIYVDVHGKLCRLLNEANNVANIEKRSNVISKSSVLNYEKSSMYSRIDNLSSNAIASVKLFPLSLFYYFLIFVSIIITAFAKNNFF